MSNQPSEECADIQVLSTYLFGAGETGIDVVIKAPSRNHCITTKTKKAENEISPEYGNAGFLPEFVSKRLSG